MLASTTNQVITRTHYRSGSSLGWVSGIAAALAVTAVFTLAIYPLKTIASPISAGVLYLLGVLVVASFWGVRMGVATAVVAGLAFNYCHIPPTGRFTIAKDQDAAAFLTFLLVAIVVSILADQARRRTAEAQARRSEADLSAETARVLLGGASTEAALPTVMHRLATALGLPSATIELSAYPGDERRRAFALFDGARQVGTLLVPSEISDDQAERIEQRIVPALEPLVAAALGRDRLLDEVVESQALRRSDELKTALLRTISHDLRTPLTAIATAGEALGSANIDQEDRSQLSRTVTDEAAQLSRLVSQLLDLSRLEAGAAKPRRDWCDIEELLREAIARRASGNQSVDAAFEAELPLVQADAAQLERAFANLLDNSLRYAGAEPVTVRARVSEGRIVVRVSNRGPEIPSADLERIFEPFHRAGGSGPGGGAGLGLAIVKGFVEANGGTVRAESLPGQGASFAIELPLDRPEEPT